MTSAMTSAPILKMISLDCSDVRAQAEFWSEMLGYAIAHVQDEYAMLVGPDGAAAVGFGLVDGFEPPAWPDPAGGKRFHFDLACDDVAAVEARAVQLGAMLAEPQPGDTWRVLLDPAGHPFCLTDAANW